MVNGLVALHVSGQMWTGGWGLCPVFVFRKFSPNLSTLQEVILPVHAVDSDRQCTCVYYGLMAF